MPRCREARFRDSGADGSSGDQWCVHVDIHTGNYCVEWLIGICTAYTHTCIYIIIYVTYM